MKNSQFKKINNFINNGRSVPTKLIVDTLETNSNIHRELSPVVTTENFNTANTLNTSKNNVHTTLKREESKNTNKLIKNYETIDDEQLERLYTEAKARSTTTEVFVTI